MHRYFIAFCHVTMRHRCSKASYRPFGRMHILRAMIGGARYRKHFQRLFISKYRTSVRSLLLWERRAWRAWPDKTVVGLSTRSSPMVARKKVTEELHGLKLQTRARKGKRERERRERERKRDERALLFRTISFARSGISSLGWNSVHSVPF